MSFNRPFSLALLEQRQRNQASHTNHDAHHNP